MFVHNINNALDARVGEDHSCALLDSGSVECWGRNTDGQLGDGSYETSRVPISVVGISDAINIDTGYMHSCAVFSGGSVNCWGRNMVWGILGHGSTVDNSPTPVEVTGISDAVEVAGGFSHNCALLSGGSVMCWGLYRG